VFYLKKLIHGGINGDTFEEVAMTLFLCGLRERVPAAWMQEWLQSLKPRKATGKARGGQAGGHARAARLSAERRREIASKAANTRWRRSSPVSR